MWKKSLAWNWITKSVFRVWCRGYVNVFSINKIESNCGKTRPKNRKVSRTKLSTLLSRTRFRDHLEGSTYQELACWHRRSRSYTKHIESREWTRTWKDGWREGVLNSCPLMMMMTVTNNWNHRKTRPLSTQESCIAYPFRPRVLPQRRRLTKVKKETAVLKGVMTEKRERWRDKEWSGRSKSRWQQSTGDYGDQSSHDTWYISRPKGKLRRIGYSGSHRERKDKYVEQKL